MFQRVVAEPEKNRDYDTAGSELSGGEEEDGSDPPVDLPPQQGSSGTQPRRSTRKRTSREVVESPYNLQPSHSQQSSPDTDESMMNPLSGILEEWTRIPVVRRLFYIV